MSSRSRSLRRWSNRMTTARQAYPYDTQLDIKYQPLEVIDVPAIVAACTHSWHNQTLCKVNDSVVRLGVIHGEYHWHKHENDDELILVVDGTQLIDHEGRTVEHQPQHRLVVPKGVMHRTRAPEKTLILKVDKAGIVTTGE
jgi:mannose-6-phosphate isomerase-like protein (cupin superfamily)